MKKLLSILLAALLILAMTTTAFAADDDVPPESETPTVGEEAPASATHEDITVPKEYTVKGGDEETYPSETLNFTVVAKEGWDNPDDVMITVPAINTADGLDITIEFPDYTVMGVYKYTVTEDAGETLGVTYDETGIEVIVTVVNNKAGEGTEDELVVYVAVYKLTKTGELGDKIEGDDEEEITDPDGAAFTNEYGLGDLTVSKTVSGNLASNTKLFDITVSFTGGEKAGSPISYELPDGTKGELTFDKDGKASLDIKLKHGDSAVFTNIPAGVEYTVVEAEKHTTGDLNSAEGYTATYTNSDNEETASGSGDIEAEDKDTVAIQNEKKTDVETGIFLDSLPYILIGVAVIAVAVVMIIRKKRQSEEE